MPGKTSALLVLFLSLLVGAPCASAKKGDEYTPGHLVDLEPGEGYLLLSIDSATQLATIKLAKAKGSSSAHVFEDIGKGRSSRLIKLPEGNYHWSQLTAWSYYWTLDGDPNLGFKVDAGVVNYPGTLKITSNGGDSLSVRQEDEATLAYRALSLSFPALADRVELRFQGRSPDPYPAFYRQMKDKYAKAVAKNSGPDPTAQRFNMLVGLPAEKLFAGPSFQKLRIDPDGSRLAIEAVHGEHRAVYIFDVATADMVKLKNSDDVTDITWVGKRTLALDTSENQVRLYHLPELTASASKVDPVMMPGEGFVMSPMAGRDGWFLFGSDRGFANGGISVYQVNGNSEQQDWETLHAAGDMASSVKDDYAWIADRGGVLRLGMAIVDKQVGIYFRGKDDSKPRELFRLDADEDFRIVGLADDGVHFYALTNRDREQTDLVLVDGKTGVIGETIYTRPGTDLVGVAYGSDGTEPIGARYAENGQIRTAYFGGNNLALQKRLETSFPDRTVFIMESSEDGKLALVGTEGPTSPEQFYLFHVADNRAELLSDDAEDNPPVYASSTVLKVRTKDGQQIESYLAMPPKATGEAPLLVLPHGGPIGARDYNLFDAETQFFASRGFAVLRVNYRGSEGFGKSFESAGKGNWGTAIEDDIQSAVEAALSRPGIDRTRVAILGSSYGGYSALMSVIRFPQQYRCAVAIAAPSDLPLMFNSSDWSSSDKLREQMTKIVGDPTSALQKLQNVSPVYQFERIQHPVLFVHGDQDRRVTIEHSLRMVELLGLEGVDAESIRVVGGGHGLGTIDDTVMAYDKIAEFLAKNLN
jgi:pimeloyl-ACP methyl ester carboxylesterase